MSKYTLYVIYGSGLKTYSFRSFHDSIEDAHKSFNEIKSRWKQVHGIELTNDYFRVFEQDSIGRLSQRVA